MKEVNDSNIKDFPNFTMEELKCKCKKYCNGIPHPISYELVEILQKIRNHFGKAVMITSFVRCRQHNKNVGGVSNSKHLYGTAVDFYVKNTSYKTLANFIEGTIKKSHSVRYYYNISGSVMHLDITPKQAPKESEADKIKRLEKEIIELQNQVKNQKKINQELVNINTELNEQNKKLGTENIDLKEDIKDLRAELKLETTYIYEKNITRTWYYLIKLKKGHKLIVK